MFKFEDVVNERFDSYPQEIKARMIGLKDQLREKVIDEIIEGKIERLEELAVKDKERFREKLYFIFLQGQKSLEKMSTKILVDMYIDSEGPERFKGLMNNIQF